MTQVASCSSAAAVVAAYRVVSRCEALSAARPSSVLLPPSLPGRPPTGPVPPCRLGRLTTYCFPGGKVCTGSACMYERMVSNSSRARRPEPEGTAYIGLHLLGRGPACRSVGCACTLYLCDLLYVHVASSVSLPGVSGWW